MKDHARSIAVSREDRSSDQGQAAVGSQIKPSAVGSTPQSLLSGSGSGDPPEKSVPRPVMASAMFFDPSSLISQELGQSLAAPPLKSEASSEQEHAIGDVKGSIRIAISSMKRDAIRWWRGSGRRLTGGDGDLVDGPPPLVPRTGVHDWECHLLRSAIVEGTQAGEDPQHQQSRSPAFEGMDRDMILV